MENLTVTLLPGTSRQQQGKSSNVRVTNNFHYGLNPHPEIWDNWIWLGCSTNTKPPPRKQCKHEGQIYYGKQRQGKQQMQFETLSSMRYSLLLWRFPLAQAVWKLGGWRGGLVLRVFSNGLDRGSTPDSPEMLLGFFVPWGAARECRSFSKARGPSLLPEKL